MEIGVDSVPRPLIADPAFDESAFALSPDGHWIAYEANLTGKREVYVRPFPNVNAGSWQLSNGGGRAALWSRKGNELYFVNPARDMMAAAIAPVRGTPGIGAITRLFHLRDEWWSRDEDYYTPHDIAPDGRFVMLERIKTDDKSQLSVVFVDHWLDELRRKVGKK